MKTLTLNLILILFVSLCYGQYSQTTTADFNGNTNFNISTINDELKLTPDLGTGADGDLYIAPGGTAKTDGTKTYVINNNPSGQNSIQVYSASGFSIGDEVLIITLQDVNTDLNTNLAGQYEFRRIITILPTALILDLNLTNTYNSGTGMKHQVIRVPNYHNVSLDYGANLTCDGWNGSIGGILCFRAKGTINIAALANISAIGKGFPGGSSITAEGVGYQGECLLGPGTPSGNYLLNSGGGGGFLWSPILGNAAAGGGGGSYGSTGTKGSNGTNGYPGYYAYGGDSGIIVGNQFLSKIYYGGAGGGGSQNYTNSGSSGKGGEGGGIIYISCDSIFISGKINCSGGDGAIANNNNGAGAGGAGAGGSIYIISQKNVNCGNNFVVSIGGMGGHVGINGGNGGNGRIRIDAPVLTGTTLPPVGYNGVSFALIGTSITQPLIKTNTQCWGTLTYTKNTSAPGTSIKVDVLNNSGSVLQSNVSSGSTLSTSNDTIKLKVALLNSYGNQTPIFHDWTLTLITAPSATITPAGSTTFCQGGSVALNANTGAGFTYVWQKNGNTISGASSSSYNATQSGSYTVIVSNGCSAASSPVAVTVNPLPPTPIITLNGNVLSSDATNGNQWWFSNNGITYNTISGATSQNYSPTQNGYCFVIVTDNNSCDSDTSNIIHFTSVDIPEIIANNEIIIYPNPTNDKINIEGLQAGTMELISSTGHIIKNFKITGTKTILDMSNLSVGVYVLRMKSKDGIVTKKLIKE
jgi:hypothetical protein